MIDNYIWTGSEFVAARDVYAIRPVVQGATMGGGWTPLVVLATAHAQFEIPAADMIPDRFKAQSAATASAHSLADLLSRPVPGVAHADGSGTWRMLDPSTTPEVGRVADTTEPEPTPPANAL